MASSSINPSQESNNPNNQLNQVLETFNKSKQDLPASSQNVEETIVEEDVVILKRTRTDQQNNHSPDVIQKISFTPLAAPCISSTYAYATAPRAESLVVRARPFEDIVVAQPGTDTQGGAFTKPDGTNSSFTKRPS